MMAERMTRVEESGSVTYCDDMTGPYGVGGPCALPVSHPHADGLGNTWPSKLDPLLQGILDAAFAYADSTAPASDTPHEHRLMAAVITYRAANGIPM